jgi:hypothetical protein
MRNDEAEGIGTYEAGGPADATLQGGVVVIARPVVSHCGRALVEGQVGGGFGNCARRTEALVTNRTSAPKKGWQICSRLTTLEKDRVSFMLYYPN